MLDFSLGMASFSGCFSITYERFLLTDRLVPALHTFGADAWFQDVQYFLQDLDESSVAVI